ncbi:hypothetical protein PLEOSDRAFT_1098611 [Pleurotus ostreatus PC15]|uniref:Uncharacterized protein n=1 Tax=Pleurotus ostreatus (strain PC15) TaxID=1137138 RepID=A0A067P9N1_PLEO1|nr:hypothetical protein PLEOSDRAFT_1098611 [Pleurotus ostreatus PC15]
MSNTMIRPEGFENVVGGDEYDKRITAGINGGRGNNNKRIHMTDDDPEAQLALIKNSVSGDLPEAAAKAAFGQLLELRDTFDALKTRNLQLQSRLCLRKVKKTNPSQHQMTQLGLILLALLPGSSST